MRRRAVRQSRRWRARLRQSGPADHAPRCADRLHPGCSSEPIDQLEPGFAAQCRFAHEQQRVAWLNRGQVCRTLDGHPCGRRDRLDADLLIGRHFVRRFENDRRKVRVQDRLADGRIGCRRDDRRAPGDAPASATPVDGRRREAKRGVDQRIARRGQRAIGLKRRLDDALRKETILALRERDRFDGVEDAPSAVRANRSAYVKPGGSAVSGADDGAVI